MLVFGKKKKPKTRKPTLKDITTAIFATAAAIFLLLLAGLSLAGSVMAFIATMPLFVVFSPVLVPAGMTATVLASGFMASGGAGATVLAIIMWLYKQITGKDPPGKKKAPAAAAKPADKPAEKPAAAAKPADKPAEKPAAGKPAEKPAADKPAAKPAADKPAAKPPG